MFELAFFLRRDIQDVREMPFDDFVKWQCYFGQRPFEWRDDRRAAHLLSALGVKAKPEAIFETLRTLSTNHAQRSLAEKLKGSSVLFFLQQAQGGDKLEGLDAN